jgi:hypothetical protein
MTTKQQLIDTAPDTVTSFTYLDAGSSTDRRIETITHTSPSFGSYTETFAYGGSSGGYYITTITRS